MITILFSQTPNDEYFQEVLDLETAFYGGGTVGDHALCTARYRKCPSFVFFALEAQKVIGAFCVYPVSKKIYQKIFKEKTYVDTDLSVEDVLPLSLGSPNYMLILDAIVDPAYRSKGIMHLLIHAFRNQLRTRSLEGYHFADLFTFCVSDGGIALKKSLGFEEVFTIAQSSVMLVRKDPDVFIKEEVLLPLAVELASIQSATSFVSALLASINCPIKICMQLEIAIDEVLSNIISYSRAEKMCVACRAWDHEIQLRFIDNGVAYDPLLAPEPDTTLSLDERGIGGLGIFMVKKSMDELFYAYENGKNILTARKRY